jgi:hypothetical protein
LKAKKVKVLSQIIPEVHIKFAADNFITCRAERFQNVGEDEEKVILEFFVLWVCQIKHNKSQYENIQSLRKRE